MWDKPMTIRNALKGACAPAAISMALLAHPALAQGMNSNQSSSSTTTTSSAKATTPAPAPATTQGKTIIVTGSLITNPNLVQSSQVSVINSSEIQLQQPPSAADLVTQLPGVAPGLNSAVNNGSAGYASVDLRDLGTNRTLVLLDGSRVVPASLTGVTDLNNIPVALIQRVDVMTGGASSVYGADAVAGVVNFITKQDFSGIDLTGTYGITGHGDGQRYKADLTVGANLADGRGNVVLNVGYDQINPVLQGDRAISKDTLYIDGEQIGSGTSVPVRLNGNQYQPSTQSLVPTYNTFNFAPYNYFQTPLKRFHAYAAAHYDVTDNIEVYSKALFNKNTVNLQLAPSGLFGDIYQLPLNNAFLQQNPIVQQQLCADPNNAAAISAAGGCSAAIASGLVLPTVINRRLVEQGPREESYVTNMFQLWSGVRGHITDNVKFDIYGSYGESDISDTKINWGLKSRVQQALYTQSTTQCMDTSNGCYPINLFGNGQDISPQAVAFFNAPALSSVRTTLGVIHGTISGTLGNKSYLWAETPIGFSVGGEYRKYTASQQSDAASSTQNEVLGTGAPSPSFTGSYYVTDIFGELIVPVIEDMPGIYNLTLEGGLRYSHYSLAGNHFTYKVGGTYEPIQGFRLRGIYAHAVRSPNISELFLPVTTGLDNLAIDPCQGSNPVGNSALTQICEAQGAPASSIGNIPAPSAGQVNATSGGNVGLGPETADTVTLGLVVAPPQLRNFSGSLDYFHIVVNDAITTPTPGDIIDPCFGAASNGSYPNADPNSSACALIGRNPINGSLNGGGETKGLIEQLTNQGRLETAGFDMALAYKLPTSFGSLDWSFQGTYTSINKFQASPTSINRECVGQYGYNCDPILPKVTFRTRLTADMMKYGKFSVLVRWLDSVNYEDPTDPSVLAAYKHIPAYTYFDLAYSVKLYKHFNITATVDNVFDRKPPNVSSFIGSTTYNSGNTYPTTYDVLGRMFTVTAGVKF